MLGDGDEDDDDDCMWSIKAASESPTQSSQLESISIPPPQTAQCIATEVDSPVFDGRKGEPNAKENIKVASTKGVLETQHFTLSDAPVSLAVAADVWSLLQEEATSCWNECLNDKRANPVKVFRRLGESFRCAPLGPKNDVDVGLSQLMKDIKREIVIVDSERFVAGIDFDALYKRLSQVISGTLKKSDIASPRALDHRVQRLLRACSRTVTGFDSYEILAALMQKCEEKCLVTPGMMDNCPILINSSSTDITINSVNIFKLVAEIADGSVVTILPLRLELTEVVSMKNWSSTRWMKIEPYDKIEDTLGPIIRAVDNFKSLMDSLDKLNENESLRVSRLTEEFEQGVKLSIGNIKRVVKEEKVRSRAEVAPISSRDSSGHQSVAEGNSTLNATLMTAQNTIKSILKRSK